MTRKGRLGVLNSDGSLRGYIAKSGKTDGLYNTWSTDPDDALLVSFTTSSSGEPFEIQIIGSLSKIPPVAPIVTQEPFLSLNRTTPKAREFLITLQSAGEVLMGKPTSDCETPL